ncbi:MAG: DUF192 domain-containing protein [Leptolyngbyaceae bacterium]|nr:DUF192 domain-containing protein [Leptolyngbyaceae bacterium]
MNRFHSIGSCIRQLMALSLGLSLLLQACSTPVETVTSPTESPNRETETEIEPPRQDRQSQDVFTISEGQMLPITAEATIREHVIQLEVAQTPRQQAVGLMFREDLPDNRGMLFPFNPPRPVQFWMRNVQFPLDMIFLYNGEIKAIAPSVPPCTTPSCPTYGPDGDVEYVLELKGGRAEALGLSVGDRVDIRPVEPVAPEAI